MSIEEQDQIHGRLLRERKEARRKVASIQAKLADLVSRLKASAAALDAVSRSAEHEDAAARAAREIPTQAAIVPVLEELATERRALSHIETQLERFE